ncbi:MAG: hypothetical protein Q9160_005464 [Pyrenula sp. 1 TL-2023]
MDILKTNLNHALSSTQAATAHLPEKLLSNLETLQKNFFLFADWLQDFLRQYVSRQTLRLIWIVGAYLLLRPYINAFFAKDVPKADNAQGSGAKVGANDIRGVKEENKKDDKENAPGQKAVFVGKKGTETTSSGAEWGDGARRRQERFAID